MDRERRLLRLSPLAGVTAPILCTLLVLQGLRRKPAEPAR
jgi:hypothetical protein